jgi:hypothetical protein
VGLDFGMQAFAALVLVLGTVAAGNPHAAFNPVADEKSVVLSSNGAVRFTVLTPQLLRIEFSRDGQFEDHATFTFLNRRLPVPDFETGERTSVDSEGRHVLERYVRTTKVEAIYVFDPNVTAAHTAELHHSNLNVHFLMNGARSTWYPGLANDGILPGTIRTLDHVR